MRKLLLLSIGIAPFLLHAQNNLEFTTELKKQNVNHSNKLELFLSNNSKLSLEAKQKMKATLAGFIVDQPYFWKTDDKKSNSSSNVDFLQNGSINGINSIIDGNGVEILVMDGGKIFEKHLEFTLPQRVSQAEGNDVIYDDHATNVAGIIGAKGLAATPYGNAAAKGVISNVNISSYSFETTNLGSNFQKLYNSNANISNHSYGSVVGWDVDFISGQDAWYFPFDKTFFSNAEQTIYGLYYISDKNLDNIVYNNPYQIIIKSAGNSFGDGPAGNSHKKYYIKNGSYVEFSPGDIIPKNNCFKGYNCIGDGSLAKNIIVVGAVNQLSTTDNKYTNIQDVIKAEFSSAGPRRDGGIKPDVTAVGVDVVVPGYNGNDSNIQFYKKNTGTSFSAPLVSGIAGALTQVNRKLTGNNNFIFKADEMKVLLTHTAMEAGNIGPDIYYGWGLVDAKKATEVLLAKANSEVIFERKILNNNQKFEQEIISESEKPLKVSISWIDPAGSVKNYQTWNEIFNDMDDTTSKIVNDLDLKIIDTETNQIYYPWRLDISNPLAPAKRDGENKVDNIEQVLIDNPVAGRKYKIEISHKGTLSSGKQDHAIIATGINLDTIIEPEPNKNIMIHPNPVQDILNIRLPKEVTGNSLSVYDLSGKKVFEQNFTPDCSFNLTSLKKGIYIIQIKTSKGTTNKKIIKEL